MIVGITIPFAMLVAFMLMHLTKIPANLLSLGAIDFGIIVDGAVVMVEAILRRREATPQEVLKAIWPATEQRAPGLSARSHRTAGSSASAC